MDDSPIKRLQYVNTGEVCSGGIGVRLNSGAIGSCVVITAFNPAKKVGAMAHVMLPGISPINSKLHDTRYAASAITKLLSQVRTFGINDNNIEICLVGGANVLKRENDHIGNDNLISVKKLLSEEQLQINAEATGGFERRTVLFDIETGCIYYTVGDSKQKTLWQTPNM